jgi:iron complex transport system permease protein
VSEASRARAIWAPLVVASVVVVAGAALVGATRIPPSVAAHSLLAAWHGERDWRAQVLVDVRLPRAVVAYLVGGALSLAGAALQGVFRNPLADPGVLGVSAGASLFASIAIFTGIGAKLAWSVPIAACLGAVAATFALLWLAGRAGRLRVGSLLLAGVALAQLATAGVTLVISLALANFDIGRQVLRWSLGGLDGRTWGHAILAAGPIALATAVLVADARALDAMLLGDTEAIAVGVEPVRVRLRAVLAAAALTGISVAVAGPVAFVGLVGPHLVRRFTGAAHARLLPACLLAGGVFLTLADVVARSLIAPEELRLGVVTAAVGAPAFLWMLARRRDAEAG